jgi:hypothetical protein
MAAITGCPLGRDQLAQGQASASPISQAAALFSAAGYQIGRPSEGVSAKRMTPKRVSAKSMTPKRVTTT